MCDPLDVLTFDSCVECCKETCKAKTTCTTEAVDIDIVIDTSLSISQEEWDAQVAFCVQFTNDLLAAQPQSRISLVSFDDDAILEATYSSDTTEIINRLGSIQFVPCMVSGELTFGLDCENVDPQTGNLVQPRSTNWGSAFSLIVDTLRPQLVLEYTPGSEIP